MECLDALINLCLLGFSISYGFFLLELVCMRFWVRQDMHVYLSRPFATALLSTAFERLITCIYCTLSWQVVN